MYSQFQATPTLKLALDVHSRTSDGTSPDNDDGTGDVALSSSDKLNNLDFVRSMLVDEAAANIVTVISGTIRDLNERHVGFTGENNSGATINATDSNTQLSLSPMPDQIQ